MRTLAMLALTAGLVVAPAVDGGAVAAQTCEPNYAFPPQVVCPPDDSAVEPPEDDENESEPPSSHTTEPVPSTGPEDTSPPRATHAADESAPSETSVSDAQSAGDVTQPGPTQPASVDPGISSAEKAVEPGMAPDLDPVEQPADPAPPADLTLAVALTAAAIAIALLPGLTRRWRVDRR